MIGHAKSSHAFSEITETDAAELEATESLYDFPTNPGTFWTRANTNTPAAEFGGQEKLIRQTLRQVCLHRSDVVVFKLPYKIDKQSTKHRRNLKDSLNIHIPHIPHIHMGYMGMGLKTRNMSKMMPPSTQVNHSNPQVNQLNDG